MATKGILLAGGQATRLYPITKWISKQLLPVYDKPMVYYPLSVLMFSGIRDILIISTPTALPQFKQLLGSGRDFGVRFTYAEQRHPRGLAEALIIGEKFIGKDRVGLILGDNVFFGHGFPDLLKEVVEADGATVFGYYVKNPQEYGVITLDKNDHPIAITEKPRDPQSHWALTGLYFYDHRAVDIAKSLKPSARGELEITDVNKVYLRKKRLKVVLLGRGYAWLDTGTFDSLIDASIFIKTIEERQGLKIGCLEEVAYRMNFISRDQLRRLVGRNVYGYGDYLKKILAEN